MSMLIKNLHPRLIFHTHRFLIAKQARQAHFLPEHIPGPYPVTKEEREAAAKKYNLFPEEYEPYNLNEECVGDYPKLPFEQIEARDPFYPWDDEENTKNFNDPIHRQISILSPLGVATTGDTAIIYKEVFQCIAVLATAVLLFYGLFNIDYNDPSCEKQFPTPGVTHYTFDLGVDETDELRRKRLEACMKEAGFTKPYNINLN